MCTAAPGGAEVDLAVPGLEVVLRIGAVQHEAAAGARDHVLDQRARQAQPAVVAERSPPAAVISSMQDGIAIGEADLLEHVERGAVDRLRPRRRSSAR